jgi:DNA-binding LacI/PurR family transcriptional regulator
MIDVGRAQAARIAREPLRPTAIVALNDMLAYGLMAGFRDAGVAIPGDVSLVGIDGLFFSALVSPALTTVQLPVRQMARSIVERIVERLADPSIATGEFVFPPVLVGGASVARAGPDPSPSAARR